VYGDSRVLKQEVVGGRFNGSFINRKGSGVRVPAEAEALAGLGG
jgi:hypothetical protein